MCYCLMNVTVWTRLPTVVSSRCCFVWQSSWNQIWAQRLSYLVKLGSAFILKQSQTLAVQPPVMSLPLQTQKKFIRTNTFEIQKHFIFIYVHVWFQPQVDGVLLSQFDICTWLNLFYILILYYSTTFWIQLFTQLHFLYVTDIVKMLHPNMQYFLISL